ncbi:hypothetical protein CEXT_260421 [Caerostris extrusa]|uniref:Uncharacterized protein n=1 Tax=Caerostris extrusa TaxID=172846 RepID=A0AAV4UFE6_CAEEX|nr:hypothetical protein CEXT_260421 [Caerostris extrusa]
MTSSQMFPFRLCPPLFFDAVRFFQTILRFRLDETLAFDLGEKRATFPIEESCFFLKVQLFQVHGPAYLALRSAVFLVLGDIFSFVLYSSSMIRQP